MSRIRKYEVGPRVRAIGELWEIIQDREYVMVHGKPTYPGWVSSWQMNMAAQMVARGAIHRAKITEAWAQKNSHSAEEIAA